MHEMLTQMLERGIIPGATYGTYASGEWFNQQIGQAQIEPTRAAFTTPAYYDLASLTKVLVTTPLLLMLMEDGKIDLNDKVQQYLPRFKYAEVTVKHLLTHASGLAKNIPQYPMMKATAVLDYMYAVPQITAVGQIEYSDVNFLLLGELITTISAATMAHLYERKIAQPLGLKESGYCPNRMQQASCVPTELHPTRGLIKGIVHDHKAFCLDGMAAHAGLFATLEDIEILVSHLFGFASPFLLTDKSRQLLMTIQSQDESNQRALGWDLLLTKSAVPIMYHTGFTGTFILVNPTKAEAAVVLTNRIHPHRHNPTFLSERDQFIERYLNREE
ncbi:serine hydrolase domain-containing protein [Brochothrix campestris]|uniref:Beta-lactamase n=1 Tax=Brochothrix campestris FSL F6-1037 TaxID=1265861 RepID=W7C7Q4_9LIST|nr:serine hydrolase domain-containing protein [Brochothrix campestris]EUJ35464.1 beta-lactamase [Brochothrix campestris FSL F6-1037]